MSKEYNAVRDIMNALEEPSKLLVNISDLQYTAPATNQTQAVSQSEASGNVMITGSTCTNCGKLNPNTLEFTTNE